MSRNGGGDILTRHIMSRLLHLESLEDRIVNLEIQNGQLEEIVLELREKVEQLSPDDDDDAADADDPNAFKMYKDLTISVVNKDKDLDHHHYDDDQNQMEIMDILQTEMQEVDSTSEPGDEEFHLNDPTSPNIIIKNVFTKGREFVDDGGSHGLSSASDNENYGEEPGQSSNMNMIIKTEPKYDDDPSSNITTLSEADGNPNDVEVEKPFKCKRCPKSFMRNQSLKRHSLKHTHAGGSKDKVTTIYPYPCSVCPMRFSNPGQMERHSLTHKQTQKNKPYQCQSCPKSFSRNYHMTQHVKAIHSNADDSSKECSICKKNFRTRRMLSHHLLSHSGKKLYECRLCNKTYTDQSALSRHNRIHNGTNLHTCTFCGRVFTRKDNHDGHVKTHLKNNQPTYPSF